MATTISKQEASEAADMFRETELALTRLKAKIEAAKSKVDQSNQDDLSDLTARHKSACDTLEAYTLQERDDLLAEKKTINLFGLKVSLKRTTPKLALKRGQSWQDVVDAISPHHELANQYLRTKTEIDKTALKNCGDDQLLKDLKLKITSEEKFAVSLS